MTVSQLARLVEGWPTPPASYVVVGWDGELERHDAGHHYPWASVSKLLTALVVLDMVREDLVALDEPAGPPEATVRHLLAHASGLSTDGGPVDRPGARRIYSNTGYELLADLVASRTGRHFAWRLRDAVLRPLGLTGARLAGNPAHGVVGGIGDLGRLAGELLRPRNLDPVAALWLAAPAFPGLPGVLPGFGRQEDNAWGLGAEIRDHKRPHWTGTGNSPRTFGHFGQAGSFLWVDPEAHLACAVLTGTPFGPWAAEGWPILSDRVLDLYR